jgi:hypothetical protein
VIVNIQVPKVEGNIEDGIKVINNVVSLLENKWEQGVLNAEFDEIRYFNMISFYEYFKYVDSQLSFILNNRSIVSNKTKEFFILRERLIRVLNPKIQLLIYTDSLNHNKTCFYAIISHLNDLGEELFSEIELDELLPEGCDEFNLYDFLNDRFIKNIKSKVYGYLKTTIEIPNNLDLVFEMQKISHHNQYEGYANDFMEELHDSIENLEINELEKSDIILYKKLKEIKDLSSTVTNILSKLQVLDLSLNRL